MASASAATAARIWPRVAPSARSIANSRVRCATVIEKVLKMMNAPTSTAAPGEREQRRGQKDADLIVDLVRGLRRRSRSPSASARLGGQAAATRAESSAGSTPRLARSTLIDETPPSRSNQRSHLPIGISSTAVVPPQRRAALAEGEDADHGHRPDAVAGGDPDPSPTRSRCPQRSAARSAGLARRDRVAPGDLLGRVEARLRAQPITKPGAPKVSTTSPSTTDAPERRQLWPSPRRDAGDRPDRLDQRSRRASAARTPNCAVNASSGRDDHVDPLDRLARDVVERRADLVRHDVGAGDHRDAEQRPRSRSARCGACAPRGREARAGVMAAAFRRSRMSSTDGPRVVDDLAVGEEEHPVGDGGRGASWVTMTIVWPNSSTARRSRPRISLAGRRVEVAGGLVGEDDRRAA